MPHPRARVRAFVDAPTFQWFIIGVIVVNSIVLGLETSPRLIDAFPWLSALGWITVAIFVVEITLRIYAHGRDFFRDPWSLFDLVVVAVALIPASGTLSVLRILRVLRVLRLLSAVRSMRRVVAALAATIPGMISIGALLVMLIYIAGVMSTQMFSSTDPENFGDLPTSLLSMFQVMTGDDWAKVISPVTDEHPAAWGFFITYILISTYIVLNLFIAVAVEALEKQHEESEDEIVDELEQSESEVLAAIESLKSEVASLRTEIEQNNR